MNRGMLKIRPEKKEGDLRRMLFARTGLEAGVFAFCCLIEMFNETKKYKRPSALNDFYFYTDWFLQQLCKLILIENILQEL